MARGSEYVIERGDPATVERLEPLWNTLREHHVDLHAHLPQRPRAESWERRRRQYLQWLSHEGSFFVVARRGDKLLGYAMVELGEGSPIWDMGERTAELQTLVVLPDDRRRHIGSGLLEAVDRELERLGVHHVLVEVMAANAETIGFYERRGYKTYCSVLHRDARGRGAGEKDRLIPPRREVDGREADPDG